jgi:thiol-disulfide isomerase/thioredoxin
MAILAVMVALIGALTVANLIFTMGVTRRLREHQQLFERHGTAGRPVSGLPIGSMVGEFSATTVDGRERTNANLTSTTLIGFFSEGCEPCEELIPRFIESGRKYLGGAERVIAVISGPADGVAATRLAGAGDVIAGDPARSVIKSFKVEAFPTLMLIGVDGRVRASDFELSMLAEIGARDLAG